jgi:hypothetical protein
MPSRAALIVHLATPFGAVFFIILILGNSGADRGWRRRAASWHVRALRIPRGAYMPTKTVGTYAPPDVRFLSRRPRRGGATQRGTAILAVRTGGTPVPRNLRGPRRFWGIVQSFAPAPVDFRLLERF